MTGTRAPYDLVSDPALRVDTNGVIRGWNLPAAAVFGSQLDGRALADAFEGGAEVWASLRAGRDVEGALAGSGRRCRLRAAAVSPDALLVTVVPEGDVEALRNAFEHLHALLARLGVPEFPAEHGLVLVAPDGTVEYTSPLIRALTGANPVGGPFAKVSARFAAAAGEQTLDSPRVEAVATDGTRHTLDHLRVALGPPGSPDQAVLHVFRDVTATIARERQLHERDRRLENARAVLNRGQHLRALGELAGEVAHEFGNVLQAIGLHVAVLRRQPGLAEGVTRSLASIKQAVDAGHAFTRRLLTFARDDNGRMEPLDVAAVLRDIAQLIEPRIAHEKRGVKLALSIPSLPEIHGSRGKLSEAFLNVFMNALEAMPQGGVLDVTAAASGGEVRIAIRDTGVGMTAEAERRAFDPFFTTKTEQAGLGLSTVYGIVRSHGGSVFIESDAGGGTAVCMSFPTAELPAMPAASAADGPGGTGIRVLVVDDHPAVREATAELLAGQGYDVVRASTVAEALAALDRHRFDVVVTDVGLPDRPGWDITRAAKERAPGTLVVLVTGWGANVSPAQAKERGADLVFEKPLDPDALLAAIARELETMPRGDTAAAR